MGNFFGRLCLWVRPILWSAAKAVGRETLRTDGKILTDIAESSPTDVTTVGDIVSKHVTLSVQSLINKLRRSGLKGARGEEVGGKKKKKGPKFKRAPRKIMNRDIFSYSVL